MALINKPDYSEIWASGGSVVEPSDVKKQTGWTAEVPPYQWENWIQNRQDQFIAHVNQRGIPQWDGQTEYEASGLSYVQGTNGTVYKSVAASGPSTIVQDPTTDVSDTYWTVAFADVGAFLTETTGDARYLQKSLNGSDIPNTTTFRSNIGVLSSTETREGLVELATTAEVDAGVLDNVVVTPKKLRMGFATSLTANGYIAFPSWLGGLIVQWGYATVTTTSGAGAQEVVVTLPTSFPNQSLGAVVSAKQPSGAVSDNVVAYWRNNTLSQITVGLDREASDVTFDVYFLNWGN